MLELLVAEAHAQAGHPLAECIHELDGPFHYLIPAGSRVIVHDDVLATGGTVEAIIGLVRQLGGVVVGACFIIELTFLGGRERLGDCDLHALIEY